MTQDTMPPECKLMILIYESSDKVEKGTRLHDTLKLIEETFPEECARITELMGRGGKRQ